MTDHAVVLKSWGVCTDCSYEGVLEYRHVKGESYEDDQALGVMLMQFCPACESSDHALIPLEYYREMVLALEAGSQE